VILGHYATALIAQQRAPRVPVWLLLAAANLPDLVWLILAAVGLEAPSPASVLDASFANLTVEMTYSHDLAPAFGLAAIAAAGAYIVTLQSTATRAVAAVAGAWCAALVLGHEASDLVAGFEHHMAGPRSPSIGLDLYRQAPELALVLEALLGAACVAWFTRARAREGRPLSRATVWSLYAIFVAGTLAWLPIARRPLGELLGVG
jgi:hypothetical protein